MVEGKIAIVTPETVDSTGRRIAIEDIASPVLKDCLALWTQRRGERKFPSREAIRPRDMAPYLRNVTLYAIAEGGDDFEYKIMGDAAVVAWGHSFMGMKREDLNRLQPGMGDVVWKVCRSVVKRRQPLVLRGQLWHGDYDVTRQETIFLPLGPDDQSVGHVLSVGSYEWAPPDVGAENG
jgi:hypothetical protein